MFIYDSTSIAFIQKAEKILKEILIQSGIQVKKSRFEINRYLYPIDVVVFDGLEWGHFNSSYFQIALNRKLIYMAKDSVVRDVLKHELAHYLTHIFYKNVSPHGKEFHEVCEKFGFPKEISKATMDIQESNLSKVGDLQSEKILEKVKKLLSLAQSSNSHEAELATLRANEILLRHNLEFLQDPNEPIYMERLLLRKRKDSKIAAIYSIIKHFIVRPVISQGKDSCCLEVSGQLTNVKLASYVVNFLDRELDYLWERKKIDHNLKGIMAKNSFFSGMALGFDEKMKFSKSNYSAEDQKAIVAVEKKLDFDTNLIYRRLSHSRSEQSTDRNALEIGKKEGHKLSIRTAVEDLGKTLYLTQRKE
jgi:hypothetical protein